MSVMWRRYRGKAPAVPPVRPQAHDQREDADVLLRMEGGEVSQNALENALRKQAPQMRRCGACPVKGPVGCATEGAAGRVARQALMRGGRRGAGECPPVGAGGACMVRVEGGEGIWL